MGFLSTASWRVSPGPKSFATWKPELQLPSGIQPLKRGGDLSMEAHPTIGVLALLDHMPDKSMGKVVRATGTA